MILVDVNIIVYAGSKDSNDHVRYLEWLTNLVESNEPIGISDLVLCGAIRILTNSRIFKSPSTFDAAFAFVERIRALPQAVVIGPGPSHWSIFERLCRESNATGNLVTDAYFAALAIEHDCELITADRDFKRFAGLRWRHPF